MLHHNLLLLNIKDLLVSLLQLGIVILRLHLATHYHNLLLLVIKGPNLLLLVIKGPNLLLLVIKGPNLHLLVIKVPNLLLLVIKGPNPLLLAIKDPNQPHLIIKDQLGIDPPPHRRINTAVLIITMTLIIISAPPWTG